MTDETSTPEPATEDEVVVEATTTEAPEVTTEAPVVTTEAPVEPVVTTTAEPVVQTTKAPEVAPEPSVEPTEDEEPISPETVRRMADALRKSRNKEISHQEAMDLLMSDKELFDHYKNLRTWH